MLRCGRSSRSESTLMAFAIYECTRCGSTSIDDAQLARAVGDQCLRCRVGWILPIGSVPTTARLTYK